jgi:nucleoside-diphosphate-sugar epimerase
MCIRDRAEAEAQAITDAKNARDAEEKAIKAQRAKDRHETVAHTAAEVAVTLTAAAIQLTEQEKILATLNRFHKR